MGWCHEFGPQISEGCDHPMVAGATSCTCEECGAACTGKFAGCADVWARGPRLVAVRAIPSGPSLATRRAAAANGTTTPPVPPPSPPAEVAGVLGDEALRTLLDQLIARCERLEAVAARVSAPVEADAGSPTAVEAVAAVGDRLEELSARLAPLEGLPARLEPLEAIPARLEPLEVLPARLDELGTTSAPATPAAGDDLTAVLQSVEGLACRLTSLEAIASRIGSLDQERSRLVALDTGLAGLAQGWERLAGRVEALEAPPLPDDTPQVPPVDHAPELKVLADRLRALEATPAVESSIPAGLAKELERLVSQVAALEQGPEQMAALERSVEALRSRQDGSAGDRELRAAVSHIERLAAEVAPLRAVPKRVEAIERTQGRIKAIDKTLATLGHCVDDLSARVAATDPSTEPETPPRVEALEAVVAELVHSVGQFSSRVAGLDEVPKRVEALEQAASPSERIVTSLAKRVDRLSTHAASVKDVAPRMEALELAVADGLRKAQAASESAPVPPTTEQVEGIAADVQLLRTTLDTLGARLQTLEAVPAVAVDQPPDRTDALVGGLGHAIDMIDQLAHQVAVLEQASGADPSPAPA